MSDIDLAAIPAVSQLTTLQIQQLYRSNQRHMVALEKILSIAGEHSTIGQLAKQAMAGK